MYIAACTTIQSSLQSHVNTPHGAQYGRHVPLLNSHGDSLLEMVVGEGFLGGMYDVSSKVSDETVGFWAKCTKGLHCYGHEVVTGLQMGVFGFLPPLGLAFRILPPLLKAICEH